MNSKRIFYLIIISFAIMGAVTGYFRHTKTAMPFFPKESRDIWSIEAKIEFNPQKSPILVSLNLPDSTLGYKIFSEQSVSAGYGFSTVQKDGTRRGEWSIREASGKQVLYYKIQMAKTNSKVDEESFVPQSSEDRVIWSELEEVIAKDLHNQAFLKSSNNETFTKELIKILTSYLEKSESSILFEKREYIDVLSKILSDAKIPFRTSLALELKDARRNQSLVPVLEVHDGKKWQIYDPKKSTLSEDKEYFLWSRGGKSLIDLTGGDGAHVSFSMVKQTLPALNLTKTQLEDSGFNFFSVHRLPIEEQSFFKILLLLPVGALVTVFMRLIIGLRTSGTFMPILLSMAFLQTSFVLGAVNFIILVAIGLLIRGYLSSLNLLLISRIATIIIIVIFLVGFMAIIGYEFGFNEGMSVAFFPIIILSWTIERMSILWEEDGPKEVFIQGFGSLLVAVIAYLVMKNSLIAHLCFNFPEINLIFLALIVLMGRYTGYRLLELRRFREFKI